MEYPPENLSNTAPHPAPARRAQQQTWRVAIVCGALFLLALLPRASGLADFLTYDEAYHWIGRTERFYDAVLNHRWSGTWQVGHPGVTAMWLGSLGLALERFAAGQGWGSSDIPILDHLAWLRLPSAVLHALLAAAAYPLLRRLVTPRTAGMAAFFWATSPSLVAHSRLLHLDALLTDFVSFALLLLLVACRSEQHRWRWLAGSSFLAGLTLLTKGPALILLPAAGLTLFWQIAVPESGFRGFLSRLRCSFAHYLPWLGVALVVVATLWPALWVVPDEALHSYTQKILWEGNNPYTRAQFFFGQPVTDPGPLFYPVASLFRMTPITLVGLVALPLALRHPHTERRTLLVLVAFAGFWALVMTTGGKKFDRYLLPAWPALLILAAAGWSALLARLPSCAPRHLKRAAGSGLIGVIGVVLSGSLVWYHPYYLSYYNPLLGGGKVAQHVLLIGWGEGTNQVGDYLRQQPDLARGHIVATDTRLLEPFVPVPVEHIRNLGKMPISYAVFGLPTLQRNVYPEEYAALREQVLPFHRVTLHGIEYALIFQVPPPYDYPLAARFGNSLRLHGYSVQIEGKPEPHTLTLSPAWDVRAVPLADYLVFVRLLNEHGQTVAQIDVSPGGESLPPTSTWQPGQQVAVPLPLPLPANLPAGSYQLVMGLYDPANGERVPLEEGIVADPAAVGDHALLVETITLPRK